MGKSEPPFLQKFRKLKPPFYKDWSFFLINWCFFFLTIFSVNDLELVKASFASLLKNELSSQRSIFSSSSIINCLTGYLITHKRIESWVNRLKDSQHKYI